MKRKLYALLASLALTAGVTALFLTTIGSGTAEASGVTYTVPGVIGTSTLATDFFCTSTATASQNVTFAVLDPTGNTVQSESVQIAPHTTFVGATSSAGFGGFAQITSTSPSLICSAMVLDTQHNPPNSMTDLPVIKGARQKGA
jgi:hypothetical protein